MIKGDEWRSGASDDVIKDDVRPPLSKKLFPVFRVWKKTASREVVFFFPDFIVYRIEYTGGGGGGGSKKKTNFLFKGGLRDHFLPRPLLFLLGQSPWRRPGLL